MKKAMGNGSFADWVRKNIEKEERNMDDSGMTDSQFKAFLRLLIMQLENAKTEKEKEAIVQELKEMLQG